MLGRRRLLAYTLGVAVVVVLVASISSCARSEGERGAGSTDASLPTHSLIQDGEPIPSATLSGTLKMEGDCLLVTSGPQRYVVLWPAGTSFANGVVEFDGQTLGRVDDKIRLGGGEVGRALAEDLATQELPSGCDGVAYWIGVPLSA